MGLVSDGEMGDIVFQSARMCLFFHELGNCEDEKEAFIRAVRREDIWSREFQHGYGDLIRAATAGIGRLYL